MDFDILIVGAGPAGMSAGIYAARGGMKTGILEKAAIGGQMGTTWEVENYPGAPEGTTGPGLTDRMKEQAESFGCKVFVDTVYGFTKAEDGLITVEGQADTYTAKAVIFALGAEPRLLGAPGERELRGLGVSYCATCDANFFKGLDCACVGGGDTALEEALYLTKFAKKVYLIHRRDEFRGSKILQDRVRANDKIELVLNSVVDQIKNGPDGLVNSIELRNVATGKTSQLEVQGVFIFAGHIPDTKFLEGKVKLTGNGYIITDSSMKTDVDGIYAAGDVCDKQLRQIVTAAADGAVAAVSATHYVEDMF